MKRLQPIIIAILTIALAISLQTGAQAPGPVTSGFGFVRKPEALLDQY